MREPWWTRLRSWALRAWALSRSTALSRADILSSAAASARITGPLLRIVISTDTDWLACRGLGSFVTSTSTRMTRWSYFSSLASFSST